MTALRALLARDLHLTFRSGGGVQLAAAFFATVAALVPFGIGADLPLLGRIAGGVLWVAAMLASLLTLDRLFQADYEDGSLDLLALSPLNLESVSAAKMLAHWITTGLPLTLLAPLLALLFNLKAEAYGALMLSLGLGMPALSAIGTIGAALTLSLKRGGLILSLAVLPLEVPAVIFGAGAVMAALDGGGNMALLLLAAFSLGSVTLAPFAAAAAVRLNLSA